MGKGMWTLIGVIVLAWLLMRKPVTAGAGIQDGIQPASIDRIVVGGGPASCGYQWDADRQGWYRAWEPEVSFVSKSAKPEWDVYIPEIVMKIMGPGAEPFVKDGVIYYPM